MKKLINKHKKMSLVIKIKLHPPQNKILLPNNKKINFNS